MMVSQENTVSEKITPATLEEQMYIYQKLVNDARRDFLECGQANERALTYYRVAASEAKDDVIARVYREVGRKFEELAGVLRDRADRSNREAGDLYRRLGLEKETDGSSETNDSE